MRHVVYDITDPATWICWGTVGVLWVTGAASQRGRSQQSLVREDKDLASRGAGAVAVIALVTPAAVWRPIEVHASWLEAAGLMLLITATAFTIQARLALGRMWTSAPVPNVHHVLRTTGPYAVTRHPIYSGILIMLVGTACTQGLGRWLAILAAVTVALISKVRIEERELNDAFGEEYARYRAKVPRLVPRPFRMRRRVHSV